MTVEKFVTLLLVCSIATSLLTEAVKKLLDSLNVKYVTNVVVLILSILVGGGVSVGYSIMNSIPISAEAGVFIAIMIVANWLVAMLGYDKIIQTIVQYQEKVKK